nr:zinc finger X-linked protein ZXDB-like [Camelus dromedarius]
METSEIFQFTLAIWPLARWAPGPGGPVLRLWHGCAPGPRSQRRHPPSGALVSPGRAGARGRGRGRGQRASDGAEEEEEEEEEATNIPSPPHTQVGGRSGRWRGGGGRGPEAWDRVRVGGGGGGGGGCRGGGDGRGDSELKDCCSDQRGYISHYVLTVFTEDIKKKKDKLFSKILIPVESLL